MVTDNEEGGFIMMRRLILVVAAAVFVGSWSVSAIAQEAKKDTKKDVVKAEYVGEKKCKMCHKDEHASWLETKHAKAYEALKPEDRKKDSCVVCHVTGFAVADTLFEGVQCEACHGPGSLYKSAKIMSKTKYKENREAQHKLALEAGLVIPDEKTCVGCHNKKSPTFKSFDYTKMKAAGVHALPKAEGEKAAEGNNEG
jgi:hypothetical protein